MVASQDHGSPAAFALLARMRTVGPYEEWLARPDDLRLPPLVVARRAHPERKDQTALNRRLAVASEIAQRLEHQNVVHCHGRIETSDLTAQLLEALDGAPLGAALERAGPIEPTLAVWVGRQIAEAIAHAHSLGEPHRGLNPEHIIVTRHGQVKVDFGLAAENPLLEENALTSFVDLRYTDPRWLTRTENHPKLDAFAVAAILWEMIVGRRYTDARDETRAPYVPTGSAPPTLETALEEVLHAEKSGVPGGRFLADRLTRIFYADLDGDDEQYGRQALAAWVAGAAERETALLERHRARPGRGSNERPSGGAAANEVPRSRAVGAGPPGCSSHPTPVGSESFDEMVAQLDEPVRPSPFTRDDVGLESDRTPDGSWAPGMALKTKLELFRSEQQPTVGVPQIQALLGEAADAARPTERVEPLNFTSQPDAPLTELQQASSTPDMERPPLPKPSRLLWFFAGFVLTFSALLLRSAL